MMQNEFSRGVIVRGSPASPRKVCTWNKAFETYLGADATTDGEAYLSAFMYPDAIFLDHVRENGFAGYQGAVYAQYVPMDFDNEDDPAAAIENAQKLLRWLETTTAADLGAVVACYSGSKGAHIRLPIGGLVCAPSPHFPVICKAFALLIARDAGAAHLDRGIYDAARILRLPNTRHGKTGRLCVPFSGADYVRMSPAAIIEAGNGERRDAIPNTDGGAWCDWNLQPYWKRAEAYVEKQQATTPEKSTDREKLNRATLEFIRDGARNGERHNRLFQAAANLGEFGASEKLARALLMEAARDSGMPLSEIESTIVSGIRHGGKVS